MKKVNLKTVAGILMACVASVMAFVSEMDSQKKDRLIEEMGERITKLENKES